MKNLKLTFSIDTLDIGFDENAISSDDGYTLDDLDYFSDRGITFDEHYSEIYYF